MQIRVEWRPAVGIGVGRRGCGRVGRGGACRGGVRRGVRGLSVTGLASVQSAVVSGLWAKQRRVMNNLNAEKPECTKTRLKEKA